MEPGFETLAKVRRHAVRINNGCGLEHMKIDAVVKLEYLSIEVLIGVVYLLPVRGAFGARRLFFGSKSNIES